MFLKLQHKTKGQRLQLEVGFNPKQFALSIAIIVLVLL